MFKGLKKKTKVLANLFHTRSQLLPRHVQFAGLTPEKIAELLQGLDEESIRTAQKYVRIYQRFRAPYLFPPVVSRWLNICTKEEVQAGVRLLTEMRECQARFHIDSAFADVSALCFHHGLRTFTPAQLQYLAGKAFVDAGAYFGDSTLCFLDYSPGRVIAFEPSPTNQKHFSETMKKNNVPPERVALVPMGLSDRAGAISFFDTQDGMNSLSTQGACHADLTTLDLVRTQQPMPMGFIKADLEGMGLEMVQGALQTIAQDRPILSLSVYHNQKELFGIYKLLREAIPNYRFRMELYCFPWNPDDLTLIGIPSEIAP